MTDISSLPDPTRHDGTLRKVGIEVELGGLSEGRVAELIAKRFGGEVETTGAYARTVRGSDIGDVEVLLDTALRDKVSGEVGRTGLDWGRAVIPVEFVTGPVDPAEISRLDALCGELARAGGFGTEDGVLLGFGLHLNVALRGMEIDDILPALTAFALVEDWMRSRIAIDPSRRALPFVDPYPASLLDRLCDPTIDWTLDRLTGIYLAEAGSRNHALDLLPILKQADPDRVVAAVPQMGHKSARPAWHYRLPDARIDDPDWSIALEWNRWCEVERIAADPLLLDRLKSAWRDYRNRVLPIPGQWASVSAGILDAEVALP